MAKKLKDKNAPKKPLSGFFIFGNYLRANDDSIKSLPVTEQASEIALRWKNLDEKEKDKYIKEAEQLKEKYKLEMEEYMKSDSYKDFQESLKEAESDKENGKRKRKKGPVKLSGYKLFLRENKDNLDEGLDEEEMAKKYIAKCGMKWKKLSEEERQVYNERAAKIEAEKGTKIEEMVSE